MLTLVTGASGFIGRHLVDATVARGDRTIAAGRGRAPATLPAGVTWVQMDWARADLGLPSTLLAECHLVLHSAGVTRALDARGFAMGNVAPTRALLDAYAAARPDGRFVYLSSQAAAGPASALDQPVTEDMAPNPVEDYGRSKLEAERIVAMSRGLRWTIVRPTAVYGPGDRDFLAVFRMARTGIGLHALDPESWVSLIHIRDLVAGVQAATADAAVGRIYFLGAHDALQWRAIYDAAAAAQGRGSMRHVAVPRPLLTLGAAAGDLWSRASGEIALLNRAKLALTDARFWIASSARARRELAWTPTVSLEGGMRETAEWYARHA